MNTKPLLRLFSIFLFVGIQFQGLSQTTPSGNWQEYKDTNWYSANATSFNISTAAELAGLAYIVNSYSGEYQDEQFINKTINLTANIDLSAHYWTPIGIFESTAKDNLMYFEGSFNGNGHTIEGLNINEPLKIKIGLFGQIRKATIENVSVIGNIVGNNYAGGICGSVGDGPNQNSNIIRNCSFYGSVTGASWVGGICGAEGPYSTCTITNCCNSANITGSADNIGGICGYMHSTITNCINTGNISGTANRSSNVGGICGTPFYYYSEPQAQISYCHNAGSVAANANFSGICGNGDYGVIEYCFNTGKIPSGGRPIGGNSPTSCFYDTQICTETSSDGSLPKLTSDMTFNRLFDDNTHWLETENMYPRPAGSISNTDIAILAAAPLFFASSSSTSYESTDSVFTDFTATGNANSVNWSSNDVNIINFTGSSPLDQAAVFCVEDATSVMLTATKGHAQKNVVVKVKKYKPQITFSALELSEEEICQNGSTRASITINNTEPGLTYSWQYSPDNNNWNNVANGTPSGSIYTNSATTTMGIEGITATGTHYYRYAAFNVDCSKESESISLIISEPNTITLTSANGTDNQTICINTDIENITYNTTQATGAIFYGLPAGVNGSWENNTATISGTPTENGVFDYTITMAGGCVGEPNSITGRIKVLSLPSGNITGNNDLCQGESTTLTAPNAPNGETYSYLWTTGEVTQSIDIQPTSSTYYSVTITNGSTDCIKTLSILVSVSQKYTISICPDIEDGTINADLEEACSGETISVTTSPSTNYFLSTLYYYLNTNPENTIEIVGNQFVMPAGNITICGTFTQGCIAPSILNVSIGNNNNFELSWNQIDGSNGYLIQCYKNSTYLGNNDIIIYDSNITTTTINAHTPIPTTGDTYCFRIYSRCSGNTLTEGYCETCKTIYPSEAMWKRSANGAPKYGTLATGLDSVYSGGTITVLKDIEIETPYTITRGAVITITSEGCTIKRKGNKELFIVSMGQARTRQLIFTNITLDGQNKDGNALVKITAALNNVKLGEGAVIQNAQNTGENNELGSAVNIEMGTFELNGGIIRNNKDESENGSIYSSTDGVIILKSGTITNNIGRGIVCKGTLKISGNPTVFGNTNNQGNPCDIFLPVGKTVTVTGAVSGGRIGITAESPSADLAVGTGLNYNLADEDAQYFTYNSFAPNYYCIIRKQNNLILKSAEALWGEGVTEPNPYPFSGSFDDGFSELCKENGGWIKLVGNASLNRNNSLSKTIHLKNVNNEKLTLNSYININDGGFLDFDIPVENANAMTVNAGGAVTFSKNLTLTGSGTLTTTSNKSDKECASIIVNNTNINASVNRFIDNSSPSQNWNWHFVSAPVGGQKIGINGTSTGTGVTISEDGLFKGLSETTFDFYGYHEPSYHWMNYKRDKDHHIHKIDQVYISNYTNADLFEVGVGYLMAVKEEKEFSFSGALNCNDVIFKLSNKDSYSDNEQGTHDNLLKGWNLVGNPFPSYLDWDKINCDAISGAAVYIWNEDASKYGIYMQGQSGKGIYDATKYIAPCQGFFVLSNNDGGRLVLDKNARTHEHDESTNNYLKDDSRSSDQIPSYPYFNISLTSPNHEEDQMIIEIDRPEFRGAARFNNLRTAKPSIYVPWENEEYSIIFMTKEMAGSSILFAFESEEEGDFTINIEAHNGDYLFLELEDLFTGKKTNLLTQNSYSFHNAPNIPKKRFVIHIRRIDDPYANEDREIFAYMQHRTLTIDNVSEESLIQIIDLQGRVLLSYTIDSRNIRTLPFAEGIYLVRMITKDKSKSQKIIIK